MRWWNNRPLRVQLVILVVSLAAVALAAAGLLATAALRGYLLNQVDQQLMQVGRSPFPGDGPQGMEHGRPDFPSDFYVQVSNASGTSSEVVEVPLGSATPEIPAMTVEQVRQQGDAPFTVPGTNGTSWRVTVNPVTNGSVATARSLADVEATVQRLVLLQLGVGIAVLALLVLVATIAVRRSLRPLVEVERTATAIAAGDLSERVPPAPVGTEVGELSAAVNTMLDSIENNIEQRDAALAESQASEARMRQFVADASHELRTPLTSVRGYSELYRQGGIGPDKVTPTFARIEGEAQRMGVLVDDLLLLARLDQARPLERREVDVLSVATDAVTSARAANPGRSVKLTVTGDRPLVVIGDSARLHQVVVNLLTNALTYSDPEPVAVTVDASSGGWVRLSVADRGPGIPDTDKLRVFERFYRSESSRSRQDGGTGLGLSIVAAIVHAHGGTVAVRDNDGGGAVFDVVLPAVPDR
jgi:two-component system, OmpR family, sensor kinase